MDMLGCDGDDLTIPSLLDDDLPELAEFTPEEEVKFQTMIEHAKAEMAAKTKLRALKRKKEDLSAGPSKKISIRIPQPILDLLKAQAAWRGIPYQTYLNHLLLTAATR